MNIRPIIYPYKMQSNSARILSKSLSDVRCKRVYENGNYYQYNNHLVINWGNPRMPAWDLNPNLIINNPTAVSTAQNKLLSLEKMNSKVRIPKFTQSIEDAMNWISNGRIVVARDLLRGCGGRGVSLVYHEDDLHTCPLYTRYVKKGVEYRVHVFASTIMFIQQKKLRQGSSENNFQIRNYDNGWIFCNKNINVPTDVIEQSLLAVDTLDLDFGAVDVGWNERYQKAFVYEVNTAPALEGTTLDLYCQQVRRLL